MLLATVPGAALFRRFALADPSAVDCGGASSNSEESTTFSPPLSGTVIGGVPSLRGAMPLSASASLAIASSSRILVGVYACFPVAEAPEYTISISSKCSKGLVLNFAHRWFI
ncbi:hypothetical protein LOK49_LG02G02996 [Camellia lanceoleosa]|uniref:Uncharacterized protein n=1 Tax=Camellia lanceoleosa TaxID=1840588 RepID=A0ACC0IHL9_9ERIC|nr:hypothetical protein LOK49_LG02G02996 [Camellia lanceoleosa]